MVSLLTERDIAQLTLRSEKVALWTQRRIWFAREIAGDSSPRPLQPTIRIVADGQQKFVRYDWTRASG
ncbi:MAG: hypothetical protein KDA85_01735 [Planctomycetaceae bacterium]|nr:hypothetical protein [Planctomycetaceae bacterium]